MKARDYKFTNVKKIDFETLKKTRVSLDYIEKLESKENIIY